MRNTFPIAPYCFATFLAFGHPGTAVSREAAESANSATELAMMAERSQALFGPKATLLSQLHDLAETCTVIDSCDEELIVVSPTAIRTAEEFIRAIPDGVPLPELAPEPDGAVSLDWMCSSSRALSISIGESPRLAYAWLIGSQKGSGVAQFSGETIPDSIQLGMQELFNP